MKKYSVRENKQKRSADLPLYSEILEKLLLNRNIVGEKEIEEFLNPDFNKIFDPFLMKDMDKAIERIFRAIDKDEKVIIFSDYDADGIPGAVILHDFFKKIGFNNFENYIPHRVLEGFGLNNGAIDEFSKNGVKLIITIDCGIADIEESKKIKELEIDLIVTDHHLPKDVLPEAIAILDPKQSDCNYPDKNLCGAGVVFKLIQGLIFEIKKYSFKNFKPKEINEGWEKWLLDMVGIATVSDMVSLTGENRIFAYFGLMVLRKSRRPGLQRLFSLLKIDPKHITEDDIGFMIAPRINAASRMGIPEDAFKLLVSEDEIEADKLARHLNKINDERKGIVASMVKEIKKHWNEKDPEKKRKVIIAGNPDWKPSLLGLVANSLLDEHNGAVFLWGREEGKTLKGSCRSSGCVDIVKLMTEAGEVFDEFGGHSMSGGFSISLEKVDILGEKLELAYQKLVISEEVQNIYVDDILKIDDVNKILEKEISKLAPFGIDNEKPLFLIENLEIFDKRIFGKNNEHLELVFKNKKGEKISAIGFFMKPQDFNRELNKGEKINLYFNLEKSYFRNKEELRMRIVDIISV